MASYLLLELRNISWCYCHPDIVLGQPGNDGDAHLCLANAALHMSTPPDTDGNKRKCDFLRELLTCWKDADKCDDMGRRDVRGREIATNACTILASVLGESLRASFGDPLIFLVVENTEWDGEKTMEFSAHATCPQITKQAHKTAVKYDVRGRGVLFTITGTPEEVQPFVDGLIPAQHKKSPMKRAWGTLYMDIP